MAPMIVFLRFAAGERSAMVSFGIVIDYTSVKLLITADANEVMHKF
jgi:hypothetical protein